MSGGVRALTDAIFVIVNPVAGKGRAYRWLRRLQRLAREYGLKCDVHLTRGPSHACDLAGEAAEGEWPLVVLLGGDGTLHEAANGLVGGHSTLALFPCGTGNDFARSVGVPRNFAGAFTLLLEGMATPIDLGKVGKRVFVNIAGVGFSADVAARASHLRWGALSFPLAVYQGLRNLRTYDSHIWVDGESIRTETLSIHVCNTRYSGAGMLFAPDADPHDGYLDLMFVERIGAWEFARTFPKMYREGGFEHPALKRRQGRHIQIEIDPVSLMMQDGEITGEAPFDVTVQPAALRMLLPTTNHEGSVPGR